MKKILFICGFCLIWNSLDMRELHSQDGLPLTVAEASDYKSTSLSAEVVEFVDACANSAKHINRFQFGTTVEGREMIGAIVTDDRPYELGQADDRAIALVIGNIHSGECAGKEALLMMLRDLTRNPDHPWLKNMVVVIVPNYSADSNDRVGKLNRRGQHGPENGMGRRENAQGLDLNRDFMKIESPEAQSLVGLIDKINPHLFIDCHTTNGSTHQYSITYDVPHNPAAPEPVRNFLRDKLMPEVTDRMEKEGLHSFYYGNFNRDKSAWTTYGYEPRYSTEYVGLRGRLAILSEAYSYISYKDRIFATKSFVSNIFDYMAENADAIKDLLQSVDDEQIRTASKQPERISMSLAAKVTEFEEICRIKGFVDDRADPKVPLEYECVFVGKYETTRSVPMPYAYLIPADQVRIVDRLLMHGVDVQKLTGETELAVEVDTVLAMDKAERAFQKHQMVRLEVERERKTRDFEAGTFVVKTAQPLGRLACYLLESESDDGLTFWNFLDEYLEVGKPYPVCRVPSPVELELADVDAVESAVKLTLGMIDGPNRLLVDHPEAPKWHGKTHQIESESWGQKQFVDAESMSFAGRQPAAVSRRDLVDQMVAIEIDKDVAGDIAAADPFYSDDRKSVIYQSDDYAVLAREGGVQVFGRPDSVAELIEFNHDETVLAFHQGGSMKFLNLEKLRIATIEAQSDAELIGKLDWVYQEELYGRGNFKGYWLNPQGDEVAFLALDESPVHPYTVTDHLPVLGKLEVTNYPKAGDPLPLVRVGVGNYRTGQAIYVDLGEYAGSEILISRVSWTADGNQLLIQVQDREQTWLDLVATDRKGGNPRKLFRDQTPAWIESPGDPQFLADGSFVLPSPRSGYSHLYHYSADGELLRAFTEGEWEVREFIGIDPRKEYLYFTASKESPLDVNPYRIRVSDGAMECLVKAPGTHEVSFSHDFAYFIDTVTTFELPSRSLLYRSDGTFLRELDASTDDRLKYVEMSKPEFLQVETGDGVSLDAVVIKPPNFDASQKYPVLVHIYAGPQAPRVRNRWGGEFYLWHQMLAQQGYVVWMCDNRSASFRGVQQAWPVHRNFAENELKDIESGVDWLKSQPWVDADRIGIWGWSYGGYMTAYAMTHSSAFRAGISGAPVTDWKNYDAIYTERYMGTPQNNPEGYEKTSVLSAAKELRGKMLLIHGTIDDNVHLSNTMQLVYELQNAGKQFELMVYPKNRHSIRNQEQKAHLRKLMTEFIVENL